MAPQSTTRDHAEWVIANWRQLEASRLKGTHRRWIEEPTTSARREQLDAAAFREARYRRERQEVGAEAIGSAPAPLHLTPFDVARQIISDSRGLVIDLARDAADFVTLVAITRRAPDAHPAWYLRYLLRTGTTDADLAKRIHSAIVGFSASIEAQIGGDPDARYLKSPCPFCKNTSLVARTQGEPGTSQTVILCESGKCEPSPNQCGNWSGRYPTWLEHELEWLNTMIEYSETGEAKEAA